MSEIITQITIDAPRKQVWEVLTNFHRYKDWNPFIRSLKGDFHLEGRMQASIGPPEKAWKFDVTIVELNRPTTFAWKGSLPLGLFKGQHYFKLEALNSMQTKLIHGEKFSGLLSWFIFQQIKAETTRGFQKMNEALKKEIEIA